MSRARRPTNSKQQQSVAHLSDPASQPASLLPAPSVSVSYEVQISLAGTSHCCQCQPQQPTRCGATSGLERPPQAPHSSGAIITTEYLHLTTSYLDLHCNRFWCRGCGWQVPRNRKHLPLFCRSSVSSNNKAHCTGLISSTFPYYSYSQTTTHPASESASTACRGAPLPHPITTSVKPRSLQPTDETFGAATRLLQPVDAARCLAIVSG